MRWRRARCRRDGQKHDEKGLQGQRANSLYPLDTSGRRRILAAIVAAFGGAEMSVRRLAAIVLIVLRAAPPMASVAGAAPQPPSAGGLQVNVDPLQACILAGQYPQFQGAIVPMDGVTRSRLFFHSALAPDFYYVEAVLEGGRYVARLPRPRLEAGPLSFYLEATRSDFAQARSGEGTAMI